MRMSALIIKTHDDLTLYFRAQSKEKDVNDLPEVNYVEQIRAVLESEDPDATFEAEDLHGEHRTVAAKDIAGYELEEIESSAIIGAHRPE